MVKNPFKRREKLIALTFQVMRYGISGVIAALFDYGAFVLLNYVGMPLFFATAASLITGLIVGFIFNKEWAFKTQSNTSGHNLMWQFLLYVVLVAFNTIFAYWFISTTRQTLGISLYLAKILSMLIIVLWNFLIYKKVIFGARRSLIDIE